MSLANLEINMFWDGLFHTLTYMMTLAGLAWLWKASKRTDVPWSGKCFVRAMVLGWGLFNFVEGIMDHHILQIHHVVEARGLSAFDYGFGASGVVLFILGAWMVRSARSDGCQPRANLR
jgi:uncharacterized membrane protein